MFMFDEPLSNLDAALRNRTRQEIANLHRRIKRTTVFVTHDQPEAMTLADRIVVMNQQRSRPSFAAWATASWPWRPSTVTMI